MKYVETFMAGFVVGGAVCSYLVHRYYAAVSAALAAAKKAPVG